MDDQDSAEDDGLESGEDFEAAGFDVVYGGELWSGDVTDSEEDDG